MQSLHILILQSTQTIIRNLIYRECSQQTNAHHDTSEVPNKNNNKTKNEITLIKMSKVYPLFHRKPVARVHKLQIFHIQWQEKQVHPGLLLKISQLQSVFVALLEILISNLAAVTVSRRAIYSCSNLLQRNKYISQALY